jgi:hypothetical protein
LAATRPSLSLQQLDCVWGEGEHNAFTDLCVFQGQLWLVFRQAAGHVSPRGHIVVLRSIDGNSWQLAAEIHMPDIDLRDPKLAVSHDGRLLLSCAGVDRLHDINAMQSYWYWSDNGCHWSPPQAVADQQSWLWRMRFINDVGYGVAYVPGEQSTTLYRLSADGALQKHVEPLFGLASHGLGYPNEHDLFLLPSGEMACLLRRDADSASAQLGIAAPPFCNWRWRDLGVRIGGPVVLPIAGQFLAAVRLYNPVRTSLCWLNIELDKLEEVLTLPSGGDTSYAGLALFNNQLYCSYYSSHEGSSAIYMAQLALAS